jgi:hypothetical protein
VEHAFTVGLIEELHHVASGAKADAHGETVFIGVVTGSEKAIAERHAPEIDKRLDLSLADETFFHYGAVPFSVA